MEVHFQYLFFEEGNGNPLQKIPWMEEPGRLQPMGLQRVGHDWATSLAHPFLEGEVGDRVLKKKLFYQENMKKFPHISVECRSM